MDDLIYIARDFQPKGGMCAKCEKRHDDCSGLDFESMPIISIDLETIIVRCTEFKRPVKDESGKGE